MKVKEYQINSVVKFGRFNGKTLSDIVSIQSDYIEWCIIHLDHFYISEDTIDNLSEINSEFTINSQMLDILKEKSKNVYSRYRDNDDFDKPTYVKYMGSYAQDIEGLSDNFIDDVLDGFEDAYWNID